VAPRAHPGDGALDLVDAAHLGLRDRLAARRRLPSGSHVPHPGITARRVQAWQDTFPSPLDIWLDGERVGPARSLSVRVETAALTVVL
jgi:diacylglycerol kinase family enzyme